MSKNNLSFRMLLAVAALASAPRVVPGQTPPQRTITSSPSTAVVPNIAPDAMDTMLRQYREMWQKMGPAQQKAFLDSGGSTPEQYERVLRTKGLAGQGRVNPSGSGGRPSPADPRAAMNALDSLTTSLQDLNAIRDGNLSRVQKDGCPPEVTSRLADLKGKLQQNEAELTGVDLPPAPSKPKERPGLADPLAIAGDWYKRPPQDQAEAGKAGSGKHESDLVADVLPAGPPDLKSPEGLQKQTRLEAEIARIKAEITQLSGACAALKP